MGHSDQEIAELDERIGTVDKFQGQEAPIVIYSLTTSSYADAPRGMEFLYSLNRINVATSRAKCLCILVASPSVFEAQCRTPRQMKLVNAFCRYLEMAHRSRLDDRLGKMDNWCKHTVGGDDVSLRV